MLIRWSAVILLWATIAHCLDRDTEAFVGWEGETYAGHQVKVEEKKPYIETLSWNPRAFVYHNFLTEFEADHLIDLARPHMVKSQVVDSDSGQSVPSEVRTSSGYFLRRGQDEVVAEIERRLAVFTQLPVENGEPLHILHYEPTQKYEPHWDYFHDTVNVVNGGQRMATVLLYLTDVDFGGETAFPDGFPLPDASSPDSSEFSECGLTGVGIRPKKGDALLFYSLKPDGSKDPYSLHTGCPVVRGDKWSATKWIREKEHRV